MEFVPPPPIRKVTIKMPTLRPGTREQGLLLTPRANKVCPTPIVVVLGNGEIRVGGQTMAPMVHGGPFEALRHCDVTCDPLFERFGNMNLLNPSPNTAPSLAPSGEMQYSAQSSPATIKSSPFSGAFGPNAAELEAMSSSSPATTYYPSASPIPTTSKPWGDASTHYGSLAPRFSPDIKDYRASSPHPWNQPANDYSCIEKFEEFVRDLIQTQKKTSNATFASISARHVEFFWRSHVEKSTHQWASSMPVESWMKFIESAKNLCVNAATIKRCAKLSITDDNQVFDSDDSASVPSSSTTTTASLNPNSSSASDGEKSHDSPAAEKGPGRLIV
jgi:hypothetical protein